MSGRCGRDAGSFVRSRPEMLTFRGSLGASAVGAGSTNANVLGLPGGGGGGGGENCLSGGLGTGDWRATRLGTERSAGIGSGRSGCQINCLLDAGSAEWAIIVRLTGSFCPWGLFAGPKERSGVTSGTELRKLYQMILLCCGASLGSINTW